MLVIINMRETHRHMDAEELERYSLGNTSPEETACLEEHLLVCEQCRAKVDETDRFAHGMKSATAELEQEGARPRRSLIPILAAAACLLLAATFALRWQSDHGSAVAVDLAVTRGDSSTAAPQGRTLQLRPDLTGLPPLGSYFLEMVDHTGRRMWRGVLASSQAAVTVPGQPAGAYFVRIYTPTGELLREYALGVR
jgi:hypothetical protein